jgi:hypothetical protein
VDAFRQQQWREGHRSSPPPPDLVNARVWRRPGDLVAAQLQWRPHEGWTTKYREGGVWLHWSGCSVGGEAVTGAGTVWCCIGQRGARPRNSWGCQV